VKHNSSTGTF